MSDEDDNIPAGEDIPEVTIIEPTPEEVSKGLAELQACFPHWKRTPGLLVIRPELGLIVSVLDYTHDARGFELHLDIREKLLAPADFDYDEYKLRCVWNQPYMDFDEDDISAPYSFYLHFGSQGVMLAREACKAFSDRFKEMPDGNIFLLSVLRACFRPDALEFLASMQNEFRNAGEVNPGPKTP